jgi:hypothetical protein
MTITARKPGCQDQTAHTGPDNSFYPEFSANMLPYVVEECRRIPFLWHLNFTFQKVIDKLTGLRLCSCPILFHRKGTEDAKIQMVFSTIIFAICNAIAANIFQSSGV